MTEQDYIKWKSLSGHQAFVEALKDAIIFSKRFLYISPKHYNRFDSLRRKYNIKDVSDAYPFIEQEAIIEYKRRFK